eukprot:CAMPEP_0173289898 /NCGR_PEP_ID=MMETSP1143-20121109/11266_1 /TAXON_ID=483371 /ORGANISM="non described non described, Strain CCMP2298" /LENGTH=72 /DNA_ID=CAMNT_0014228901 /DNA_START=634 /DNA_END=852 /DNA_ORIENTATION=-
MMLFILAVIAEYLGSLKLPPQRLKGAGAEGGSAAAGLAGAGYGFYKKRAHPTGDGGPQYGCAHVCLDSCRML